MKKDYIFSILIMPYEDGYMAMCKETGLIRQGTTLDEAHAAIMSAMNTLISLVLKDNKYEVNLSVGLPLAYRVVFHWTITKMHFQSAMKQLKFERNTLKDFQVKLA
jgi:predicted RNase H-like HicB family nuclease